VKTVNGAEIVEALKDADALIATTRLWSGEHVIAEAGQRVNRRSWFVPTHADLFVEVQPAGLDRGLAVRCVSAVDVRDERPGAQPWATRRLCWPGQLLSRDDELVIGYPARFAEEPQ
jgi:hypothetical protein